MEYFTAGPLIPIPVQNGHGRFEHLKGCGCQGSLNTVLKNGDLMSIRLGREITGNFDEATHREWLETNGLGGWAGSTLAGAHTRRYHGILVAATRPPVGRIVMLSRLDETIVAGENRYELGCNQFPGAVHPQGYQYLTAFEKDPFPVFSYCAGEVRLTRTVAACNGENTTLLLYQVEQAPGPFVLELQPFLAARDYHMASHANEGIEWDSQFQDGIFRVQAYQDLPCLHIQVPGAEFESRPFWYYAFEYQQEKARGLEHLEDLFTHGKFTVTLQPGSRLGVIVSISNPAGRDAFRLFQKEKERREDLLLSIGRRDDLVETLTLAADQFIVRRGRSLRTVIAGYHWFTDWGRDTMISLAGLCLVTGRFEDGRKILESFSAHVSQGMLPNRFPDEGEKPEYNTVDGTLWFFVAAYKYWHYTRDDDFIRNRILPLLGEILSWHDRSTRFGIHVESDGLLHAGEEGSQLTWMDARVGDWVVTPRQGKVVEVNALWYNCLAIYAELQRRFGSLERADEFEMRAERVKARFKEVFWNAERDCLYDVVARHGTDDSIRPNQILALSLPFPLLDPERAAKVLAVVEKELLTPFGLRSLSRHHPDYRPKYQGNQRERDAAYHQGTVWSWLLGPYFTALVRVRGEQGRLQAVQALREFQPHLSQACLGTVSEIFDGDPPHAPRGAVAQAWSVAEILRACLEDLQPAVTTHSDHAVTESNAAASGTGPA